MRPPRMCNASMLGEWSEPCKDGAVTDDKAPLEAQLCLILAGIGVWR